MMLCGFRLTIVYLHLMVYGISVATKSTQVVVFSKVTIYGLHHQFVGSAH